MYSVYGMPGNRTFRVLWMLEELGAAYEFHQAEPRSKEIHALTPSGKTPVVTVDGVTLTDSTAILAYIADRHGAMTYPAGTMERARQDGFTFAILDEIESLIWMAARHSFVLPEHHRLPEIKDSLKLEFELNIARLGHGFTGPFLMGEMMTIPDIVLGHCLSWAKAARFPTPPEVFTPYSETLSKRPAYQAAQAWSAQI